MGGNIPGGIFLGGSFPRGNLPGGKEFDLWKFFEKTPGGSFPDTEKIYAKNSQVYMLIFIRKVFILQTHSPQPPCLVPH